MKLGIPNFPELDYLLPITLLPNLPHFRLKNKNRENDINGGEVGYTQLSRLGKFFNKTVIKALLNSFSALTNTWSSQLDISVVITHPYDQPIERYHMPQIWTKKCHFCVFSVFP